MRVGGAWRTVMRSPEGKDHIVSGVYSEITPPARLVFTWGWETEGGRGHETVVTIELFERPGGTRLELTHERFESEDSLERHRHGWSSCLDCLEERWPRGRSRERDQLTLADLVLAPILSWLEKTPEGQAPLPNHPALARWDQSMSVRASSQATIPPMPGQAAA